LGWVPKNLFIFFPFCSASIPSSETREEPEKEKEREREKEKGRERGKLEKRREKETETAPQTSTVTAVLRSVWTVFHLNLAALGSVPSVVLRNWASSGYGT